MVSYLAAFTLLRGRPATERLNTERDAARMAYTETVTAVGQTNHEIFAVPGVVAAAACRDHAMTWTFFRVTWDLGHKGSMKASTS